MKLFKKILMICSIFFIVGCSPKEDEPDIPVVVEPIIELAELEISSEEMTLEIGSDFAFPTVTCSDNGEPCEATLVGEYDFSEVGEYTVTYIYMKMKRVV